MEQDHEAALALMERMEKGESIQAIQKSLEATPATPPAPVDPAPVAPAAPAAPAPTPTPPPAPPTKEEPAKPKAGETEDERIKRLEAQLEETNKRFGELRRTRDEKADKLAKELEDLKAKEAERERQAQLAALDAKKPDGFDDLAPILEHAKEREKITAPTPPAASPAAAEPEPATWFAAVTEEVPEFPDLIANEEFKNFLAAKLANEGAGQRWKTDSTWAALKVTKIHGEFQAAKKAAAEDAATRQNHLTGTEIPNGAPGPKPSHSSVKTITQDELNRLLIEDKEFKGKPFNEVVRLFQAKGYQIA